MKRSLGVNKIEHLYRLLVLISVFSLQIGSFYLYAADIEAGRMEILNTPEGRVTVFKNGVSIIDRETKIIAQNARFYEDKNFVIVHDSVNITNPSAIIISDTANYYLDERITILKGNVKVTQESLEITAPELTVEYQKDRASAKKGFVIVEQAHSIQITGITGEYYLNREEGVIDSQPQLLVEQEETLKVYSQKLSFKNKAATAFASGKVKATSGQAVLLCDTLIYNWEKDSGKAFVDPILKENNNELKGKTIYFFAREGKLERMEIEGDASGYYYNDVGDKVVVEGESLHLFFSEGKTYSISVKNVQLGKLYRHGVKS